MTRSADLSITKTDSIDPVNPGQAFTYTLTVTNNGPSDAATLTVSDTVPAQFTVTSVTSPAGACGFAGNVVTCTRPTFVNLATWVITVFGHHDPRRARRHVHQHRHGERGHRRPDAGEQLRVAEHHGLGLRRPGGHEDRRRGVGRGGHVDHLHDHADEQRPVRRGGRRRRLGPDPRGTVGSETEPNCAHRGRHVHLHDDGRPELGGLGRLPAHAWRSRAGYAPATLVNTASIDVVPGHRPDPGEQHAPPTPTP